MSKQQKSGSCLGLFIKSFILSGLLLVNLTAALVLIAVKFLGADYGTWTDFSSLTSYPVLALLACLLTAGGLAFFLALAGTAIKSFLGSGGKQGSTGSSRASSARPQSSRKTTV